MLNESVFGWTGRDCEFNEQTVGKESAGLFIQSSNESEENLSEDIRSLWEVENLGEENVGNRYESGLLWKRNPGDLSDNFDLARRQFNKVWRVLKMIPL
ncbi:hypothetical protein CDAR_588581 [Caerostris darwini]|uniref:Uncharacterized protein n=1 Tax=Caerostris darwini TaxID=1538125 RepID=A0AAV4MHS3_9ARAC|nr:hypothetical protein CDAR_588581 [Caerostris darwini]